MYRHGFAYAYVGRPLAAADVAGDGSLNSTTIDPQRYGERYKPVGRAGVMQLLPPVGGGNKGFTQGIDILHIKHPLMRAWNFKYLDTRASAPPG